MADASDGDRLWIETPMTRAGLLQGPRLLALAARVAAWIGRWLPTPIRFGKIVVVIRHAHVVEALRRDLDFLIAPVNAPRIQAVNGPFVLGMDRCPQLDRERGALYAALGAVDLNAIMADAATDAAALVRDADRIDAVADFARVIAGKTAQRLFGITPPDFAVFLDAVRAVFAHTFLNLNSDEAIERRALAAAPLLQRWFEEEVASRRATGRLGDDMMGALLRQAALDDDGVRRTLGGMLVGSIDTTAGSVAKAFWVIDRDPEFRAVALASAMAPETLYPWCLEALRRWPHNPILLRQAAEPTVLAGRKIGKDGRVFLWTQAAMLDTSVFPEPNRMRPDRDPGAYLHLGGGVHTCAGRELDARQIPLLVGLLLQGGYRVAGPIEWAGPFPARLPVSRERTAR